MKGLDLRHFKKVKMDQQTATLRHPKGHEITIALNALTPKMRGELHALPLAKGGVVSDDTQPTPKPSDDVPEIDPKKAKDFEKGAKGSGWDPEGWKKNIKDGLGLDVGGGVKMSEGGEAQDPIAISSNPVIPPSLASNVPNPIPDATIPQQMTPEAIAASNPGAQPYGTPVGAMVPVEAPAQAPVAPAPQEAPVAPTQPRAEAPKADPFGVNAYDTAYTKGLTEQKAGLAGEAGALGVQGAESAKLLQQAQVQQQQNINNFNTHFQTLDTERKALMQDIQNQHIDPNRFMNSMGTGERISTAIGLILGGIGGGITHQESSAMKFLNAQIDRDIQSQKDSLGKTESLLNANFHQFGNLKDATDMTRVMQSDIVSNQLKEAAAKAQDPLAKARALQAAGVLDKESAAIVSQTAMRRTLLTGAANGQVDPARVVNLLVPEHQRAEANKELGVAQNMVASRDNLINAFDKLSEINTVGGRVTSPLQTSKQVDAIKGPLLAQLSKDSAGRFTEADAKMLDGLFPAPGDSAETLATKKNQMAKVITEKMHFPILQTYGINPNSMGQFNNQGASRIPVSAPVKK